MTLMLGNKWTAKLSNDVLQATCNDPNNSRDTYFDIKSGKATEQFVQFADDVSIQVTKNKSEKVRVILVGFGKSAVEFAGQTKSYF